MRVLITLCFSAVYLAASVQSASACSCRALPPVAEAFADADAVFAGEVIELREDKSEAPAGRRGFEAKFRVERSWKLVDSEEAVVKTSYPSIGTCGYPFAVGTRVLVYADCGDAGGSLETSICTWTRDFPEAQEQLSILGEGKVIQPRPPDIAMSGAPAASWLRWLALGGLAFAFAVGVLTFLKFVRRRAA